MGYWLLCFLQRQETYTEKKKSMKCEKYYLHSAQKKKPIKKARSRKQQRASYSSVEKKVK